MTRKKGRRLEGLSKTLKWQKCGMKGGRGEEIETHEDTSAAAKEKVRAATNGDTSTNKEIPRQRLKPRLRPRLMRRPRSREEQVPRLGFKRTYAAARIKMCHGRSSQLKHAVGKRGQAAADIEMKKKEPTSP
ncbi:hypothetical protein E3N88_44355 [Mikania micrantha]|uniref:Uncharacterized protein n=1 Tax=Mikania micrantha TaxID=192012 RepID=A0A5N6LEL4_9ASTR|nr:hypothetical protein E3N88_44355 [Mikania micrantha]